MAVEPVDDGREHPLVIRDVLADRPVVLLGRHAEVAGDTMLVAMADPTVVGALFVIVRGTTSSSLLDKDLLVAIGTPVTELFELTSPIVLAPMGVCLGRRAGSCGLQCGWTRLRRGRIRRSGVAHTRAHDCYCRRLDADGGWV